jgi:hypothetical protein
MKYSIAAVLAFSAFALAPVGAFASTDDSANRPDMGNPIEDGPSILVDSNFKEVNRSPAVLPQPSEGGVADPAQTREAGVVYYDGGTEPGAQRPTQSQDND